MLLTVAKTRAGAMLKGAYKFMGQNPFALSVVEVIFTIIISNAALVFLIFTYLVDTDRSAFSLSLAGDIIRTAVSPSEVLVYLLAIIAPALWIMAHNWRARKHVGFYWLLLMVQAVIVVGSAYIYGRAKSGGVGNPDFVFDWAIGCLVVGITVWYITLVYKRLVLDEVEASREPSGKSILDELGGANRSRGEIR